MNKELAMQETVKSLLRTAKHWRLQCSAKEAIKQAIGLGGGGSLQGSEVHGFTHHQHYTSGLIEVYSKRFEHTAKFTPAQYMPFAKSEWARMQGKQSEVKQLTIF